MNISDYIDTAAIILAPIISVIIGQKLQDRAKKRQDKMEIFKALMSSRVCGWTNESVYSLNIMDVVFADDKKVRAQWKAYYDKLCIGNPTEEDFKKIETEKCKLLEAIAESLGYKNKITWETIQNPYIPKGLSTSMMQQQQYQNGQLEIMEMMMQMMKSMFLMKSGGGSDGQAENGNPGLNPGEH